MSRDYYVFDEEYKTELKPYLDLTKNTFFQDPDYGLYFDDSFQEYVDSAEFKSFSLCEQKMAGLAINACMDNRPWHIQEYEPDDGLFVMPKSLHQIKANKTDAAVLSGMTGWQAESELLDYDSINLKKEIGNVALRDYVNLGLAVVLNKQDRLVNGHHALSYYTEEGSTILRQTVGGTTHGDFTAGWARYASHGPAVDPSCQKRLFAPAIERNGINAYHSVEDSLAITMLSYLAKNDNNLLEKYKGIILDSIDKADLGRGSGPFADFGDDNFIREHMTSIIHTHKNRTYSPEEVLESFITFARSNVSMQVVCLEDGVELRNVSEETDDNGQKHEVVLGRMPIASENIPNFIATMAAASAGRTSISQIRRAISEAHFVDLNK